MIAQSLLPFSRQSCYSSTTDRLTSLPSYSVRKIGVVAAHSRAYTSFCRDRRNTVVIAEVIIGEFYCNGVSATKRMLFYYIVFFHVIVCSLSGTPEQR